MWKGASEGLLRLMLSKCFNNLIILIWYICGFLIVQQLILLLLLWFVYMKFNQTTTKQYYEYTVYCSIISANMSNCSLYIQCLVYADPMRPILRTDAQIPYYIELLHIGKIITVSMCWLQESKYVVVPCYSSNLYVSNQINV